MALRPKLNFSWVVCLGVLIDLPLIVLTVVKEQGSLGTITFEILRPVRPVCIGNRLNHSRHVDHFDVLSVHPDIQWHRNVRRVEEWKRRDSD